MTLDAGLQTRIFRQDTIVHTEAVAVVAVAAF